jgi:hypothetical protein
MSSIASALDGDQEVLGRDPGGAAGATIEAAEEVRKRLDELRPAALRFEHGTSGDERPEVRRVIVDRILLGCERLAGMSGVAPAAAKTSLTWLSTPHSGGGCTPSGGGGMNDPLSLKSPAEKPSSAQVVIATRPPLRQTRTNSAAARA